MDDLTADEASQQVRVLDSALAARLLDTGELPGEVVAELVRVELLAEHEGKVAPTPAAIHYAELLKPV
jgi:hypothetical protein